MSTTTTIESGLAQARGPLRALLAGIDPGAFRDSARLRSAGARCKREAALPLPMAPEHLRLLAEILVDHLICVLDETDPDPDGEPTMGFVEPDTRFGFGVKDALCQEWPVIGAGDHRLDEGEDGGDTEPSLGWTPSGLGGVCDLEGEHTGHEPDVDDEPEHEGESEPGEYLASTFSPPNPANSVAYQSVRQALARRRGRTRWQPGDSYWPKPPRRPPGRMGAGQDRAALITCASPRLRPGHLAMIKLHGMLRRSKVSARAGDWHADFVLHTQAYHRRS